ncbi:hypothetical protein MMC29_001170 [Sticta canariensis]|nr:hypothetical protein [Sticta canariensis]
MLSHGTSSASNRLRRAKSSSSTQATYDIPVDLKANDPAIAHQDALAAASFAFERASERATATQEIKELSKYQLLTLAPNADDVHHLSRKQSVRFTGPTAVLSRDQPITRRVAPNQIPKLGSPTEVISTTQKTDEFSTYQPENYLKRMPKSEENYARNRVSSVPSSYRKLRKARSMFNPRSHRPVIFTNGTPKKESQVNRQPLHSPVPRLRRSFSFLRGDSDELNPTTDQNAIQDAAIQIARDRYLHQLEHQRLKEEPSNLALGKHPKPQKAFRKTVRTSSVNSSGSAVGSAAPLNSRPVGKKGFGHKARGFSLSLKNKLKRVFQRPSDTAVVFPVQQVDASRPHFGDYMSTFSGVNQQYLSIPLPECEIIRKVSSRESVCLDVPVMLGKTSHPGSIRSVRSDDEISNGKSRVTSWTNSTAANTMTSNQLIEKKRLSIIQENGGPHQPSSSVRHYGDLVDVFHQPIRSNHTNTRAGNVDSQRIFSALQRRIDENKRMANLEGSDRGTETEADKTGIQSSSTERVVLRSRTADNSSTDSLDIAHGMRVSKAAVFKPSTISTGYGFNRLKEECGGETYQHKLPGEQVFLTPQLMAERNESESQSPKRPLRELKSTFFPSTMRIERSNISPYRRAMNTSNEDQDGAEIGAGEFGNGESENSPFRRITPNSAIATSVTGTESIYSRTSSGNTPKPATSSLSLAMSAGDGEPGSAVIITTRARKHKQSLSAFGQPSSSSLKPSEDLQKWMASQVDKLGNQGGENRRIFEPKFVKENGHKRESAQIDGDDVRIGKMKALDESPKQPLGIIQGNAFSRPALRHQTSLPMVDRFPLLEIGQLAQLNTEQNEADPTTPPNKWSEANHEHSSGWRNNALAGLPLNLPYTSAESPGNKDTPRQGHFTDSENTERHNPAGSHEARVHGLMQVKKMDKLQSRYSPERIARLRRRQSTNGLVSEGAAKLTPEAGEEHHLAKSQMIDGPAIRNTPKDGDTNLDGLMVGLLSPVADEALASGGRKLVDVFLSNRRRHMRMSEEIAANPAFL